MDHNKNETHGRQINNPSTSPVSQGRVGRYMFEFISVAKHIKWYVRDISNNTETCLTRYDTVITACKNTRKIYHDTQTCTRRPATYTWSLETSKPSKGFTARDFSEQFWSDGLHLKSPAYFGHTHCFVDVGSLSKLGNSVTNRDNSSHRKAIPLGRMKSLTTIIKRFPRSGSYKPCKGQKSWPWRRLQCDTAATISENEALITRNW